MLSSGSKVVLPRTSKSSQALKLQAHKLPTSAQVLKPQARGNKLQDLRARVQAAGPKLRGASDKNKCILSVFNMEGYLMG